MYNFTEKEATGMNLASSELYRYHAVENGNIPFCDPVSTSLVYHCRPKAAIPNHAD
jgi:hypothetical protein